MQKIKIINYDRLKKLEPIVQMQESLPYAKAAKDFYKTSDDPLLLKAIAEIKSLGIHDSQINLTNSPFKS